MSFMLKMNTFIKSALATLSSLVLFSAAAQSLPPVVLKPVFTALQGGEERPVWMSEAQDGTHRMFIVYQSGKILVVKKGSDGSDAKEFLNIEDRNPRAAGNEDGLMSIAFHPGFATNGLFYIYYNQVNTPDDIKRLAHG